MVVQIAFFNSPQNFSTRECAHRNNDTQKICIFIQRPLISIHCNNKNRQILCKLEYGRPFSVFVNLYRKKNKFYFYSTSKNILIPVQSNHPDIIQYYIVHKYQCRLVSKTNLLILLPSTYVCTCVRCVMRGGRGKGGVNVGRCQSQIS